MALDKTSPKSKNGKYEIPFIDLNTAPKADRLETILEHIQNLYENSQFVLGPQVGEFESAYARLCGCNFGVGVNSGTDAMILSFRALGIGEGDEVITVANSFIATASSIALCGAKPVFVDVDWDYNIDPTKIEAAITPKTKAILVVHLTGLPCKMDAVLEIAKQKKLFVVEDAAQSIGAKYKGKATGSFGETGCFSLHPLKNLHIWGDGGMITTDSEELSTKLVQQRNHGLRNRDEVEYFSFNSRLDSIQAVVGMQSIGLIEKTIEARRKNAKIYDERLKELEGFLDIPKVASEDFYHPYHLYVVAADRRTGLRQHLDENGIETKIHYPIPIHLQKAAQHLGYKRGSLPVTEELSQKILSLPIRENLTENEIHQVCDQVSAFYQMKIN